MKRTFFFMIAAGLLTAGVSFAADNSAMQEMMQKMGGQTPDERVELKLPDAMKVMQKKMMREHLDTIAEITGAIAAGDLPMASTIAREKLGWNPQEEQRCNMVGKVTGEKDFVTYGMAVHKTADELSTAAAAGDRDKSLALLSTLIKNCNACHEKFRH
ncbi:MAG: cytochrome c [Deltaproteobacteria bacterium]|nr:cytochrome c [Deltaproteobacteria bacterium]